MGFNKKGYLDATSLAKVIVPKGKTRPVVNLHENTRIKPRAEDLDAIIGDCSHLCSNPISPRTEVERIEVYGGVGFYLVHYKVIGGSRTLYEIATTPKHGGKGRGAITVTHLGVLSLPNLEDGKIYEGIV